MDEDQIDTILGFLHEYELRFLDINWLIRHTKVTFDDATHSMTLVIDNINEEDYKQMKDNK